MDTSKNMSSKSSSISNLPEKEYIQLFEKMNSDFISFEPCLIPFIPNEDQSFWNIQI